MALLLLLLLLSIVSPNKTRDKIEETDNLQHIMIQIRYILPLIKKCIFNKLSIETTVSPKNLLLVYLN